MIPEHCSMGRNTVNADVVGTDDKCAKSTADALPTKDKHYHLCMQYQPESQIDGHIVISK